jgi:hypothetical protein
MDPSQITSRSCIYDIVHEKIGLAVVANNHLNVCKNVIVAAAHAVAPRRYSKHWILKIFNFIVPYDLTPCQDF